MTDSTTTPPPFSTGTETGTSTPIRAALHHSMNHPTPTPLTTDELNALSIAAVSAKATAYCPYSKFRVGCALLSESGEVITGANVENAAYPVGTCAERVAIGTAVVSGHRKFRAIAVATDISPPASPCGMCRQFIREFCGLNTPIYMYDKAGKFVCRTIGELLPMSFGPDSLPSPEENAAAAREGTV